MYGNVIIILINYPEKTITSTLCNANGCADRYITDNFRLLDVSSVIYRTQTCNCIIVMLFLHVIEMEYSFES